MSNQAQMNTSSSINSYLNTAVDSLANILGNSHVTQRNYRQNGTDNVILKATKVTRDLYKVTYYNGTEENIHKEDLSDYTIETCEVVDSYNQAFVQNMNRQNRQIDTSKRTMLYARTSSHNDTSIETQKQCGLNYMMNNGMYFMDSGYHYDSGVSGRNGYNLEKGELKFWKNILNEGDNLVVYCVDRLSRSVFHGLGFLNELYQKGVSVHFINETIIYNEHMSPLLKSTITQQLNVAENESNKISQKVNLSITRRLNEGHHIGSVQYGYKTIRDKGIRKKVKCDKEDRIIKLIKHHVRSKTNNPQYYGTKTRMCTEIAEVLNTGGHRYRNGNNFTYKNVMYILNKN